MAIHHISACADPRTEGSAAFEQQLREDILLRNPRIRSRSFRIVGFRNLLCRNVNMPHLRQYTVHVVTDDDVLEAESA